ncbi:MAG: TPM domain-containing protein [Bacteroidota bacterium]|nr:TPM domain-containing protein [Bacteroidota bacterium]
MWPFPKKKHFFTQEENDKIVQSIQEAERQTSGEIRIFVEHRCKYVDPLDRAAEIFANLQMEKTELRNGVLFYIATKDKQLAIFADSGIHSATGEKHWKEVVQQILAVFSKESIVAGITTTIAKISDALKTHFPYDKNVDKNELPDEIVFGS